MLSNRFDDEEKARVWIYNPTCANCDSNQGVAGHHIYGCREKYTDSIVNCIFLCHLCHQEADGQNLHQTGNPLQIKYLGLALRQVVKSGHEFTEKDKRFLESVEADVQEVLH
jgi:hypothetical protein